MEIERDLDLRGWWIEGESWVGGIPDGHFGMRPQKKLFITDRALEALVRAWQYHPIGNEVL